MNLNSKKITDDEIYEVLNTAIAERYLAPETHMPEDELAKRFKVSRTRIRKVLQRLIFEKLVEYRPNCGVFVASLSVKEVQDIFAARRIVEAGLIECITFPLSKAQIKKLYTLLEKEHNAIAEKEERQMIRLSGELHLAIAELAGNGSLVLYLEKLLARTSIAISIYQKSSAPFTDNQCHVRLVELLVEGNVKVIQKSMLQHLSDVENGLDLCKKNTATNQVGDVLGQLMAQKN